jgi:hypothetical protein
MLFIKMHILLMFSLDFLVVFHTVHLHIFDAIGMSLCFHSFDFVDFFLNEAFILHLDMKY